MFKKQYNALLWLVSGMALCFATLLPYSVVGKWPYIYNWDSRHQLLMPIGVAFWFYRVLNMFKSEKIKYFTYSLLIAVFSFGTLRMYLSVQGLRYQDLSLQQKLVSSIDLNSQGSYILLNRGDSPGMLNHDWNFYELTGMVFQATGQHRNPIIMGSHLVGFKQPELWLSEFQKYRNRYMVQGAEWKAPFYCLRLIENQSMDELSALRYLFSEYFEDSSVFKNKVQRIYTIDKKEADTSVDRQIRC